MRSRTLCTHCRSHAYAQIAKADTRSHTHPAQPLFPTHTTSWHTNMSVKQTHKQEKRMIQKVRKNLLLCNTNNKMKT